MKWFLCGTTIFGQLLEDSVKLFTDSLHKDKNKISYFYLTNIIDHGDFVYKILKTKQ